MARALRGFPHTGVRRLRDEKFLGGPFHWCLLEDQGLSTQVICPWNFEMPCARLRDLLSVCRLALSAHYQGEDTHPKQIQGHFSGEREKLVGMIFYSPQD